MTEMIEEERLKKEAKKVGLGLYIWTPNTSNSSKNMEDSIIGSGEMKDDIVFYSCLTYY